MATMRVMEPENPSIRGMQDQFGVVPIPKYHKTSENKI